jgi:GGDEF domain-containing protein
VLAQFAQQVRLLVGEEGMVARIGGEEFAVAALTSSEWDGQVLAEKFVRESNRRPSPGGNTKSS